VISGEVEIETHDFTALAVKSSSTLWVRRVIVWTLWCSVRTLPTICTGLNPAPTGRLTR
jgi:hypothetical protein